MEKTNELKSVHFTAGKRSYFFDVKKSQQGAKYLKIKESKRDVEGNYMKNSILIYEEDISKFIVAMREILKEFDWKIETPKVKDEK